MMDDLTKESLAGLLTGREYPLTISEELAARAKASGLVIVYGQSDDLMEFDGAIYDEKGCYNGGTAYVDAAGLIDRDRVDDDDDEAIAEHVGRKKNSRSIVAVWGEGGYSWTYRTDIPHATFEVVEDGEPYCRGIVFALADLPA